MDLSVIENDPVQVKKYLQNFVPINYYQVLGDAYLHQVRAVLNHSVSHAELFNPKYDGLINDLTVSMGGNYATINTTLSVYADMFRAEAIRVDRLEVKAANAEASVIRIEEASASQNQAQASTNERLEAKLEDIVVGGRNLMQNSLFKEGYSVWGEGAIEVNEHYIGKMHKVSTTGAKGSLMGIKPLEKYLTLSLVEGTEYTISFYAYGSINSMDKIYLTSPDNPPFLLPAVTISGDLSARRHITFKAPFGGGGMGVIFGATAVNAIDWFSITLIKVELGNKPTDWTPAPEDVDGYIGRVQSTIDSFKEVQVGVNEASALVRQEMDTRLKDNAAKILEEKQTRTTLYNAESQKLLALTSRTGANEANLTQLDRTFTNKFITEASRTTTLEVENQLGKARIESLESVSADNTRVIAESSTVLNAKIDGVEVGGRNLISNSDFKLGYKKWGNSTGTKSTTAFGNTIKLTANSNTGEYFGLELEDVFRTIKLIENRQYVLSFYAGGTVAALDDIWINGVGLMPLKLKVVELTTDIADRFEVTFISPYTTDKANLLIGTTDSASGKHFSIVAVKLERGNKATDWTTAPEDTMEAISGVEANVETWMLAEVENERARAARFVALEAKTATNEGKIVRFEEIITEGLDASVIIKDEITAEYTQAIKDIEVGGRNYIADSGPERTAVNATTTLVNAPVYGPVEDNPIMSGGEFVLSFWYKGTSNVGAVGVQFYVNNDNIIAEEFPNSTVYVRRIIKFTLPAVTSGLPFISLINKRSTNGKASTVTFKNVKIESGNKVTDWTPASEDLEQGIKTNATILETKVATADLDSAFASERLLIKANYDSAIATALVPVTTTVNKSVSRTDIEYYLSTSNTTPTGGSWLTAAPVWAANKYMFSRVKTTFNDKTSTYTPGVNGSNISGAKGADGTIGVDGAVGQGIASVTGEYAVSTSKTVAPSSWSTATPVWTPNKYVWSRIKIVYKDPAKTAYTTPIVDSAWEAVNELEIGGTNLILASDTPVTSSSYGLQDYTLTDTLVAGEQVTVTVWGKLGAGKLYFSAYNSGGSGGATLEDIGNNVHRVTFNWVVYGTNSFLRIYHMASSTIVNSTITRVKLERGNKGTGWSPSPEDNITPNPNLFSMVDCVPGYESLGGITTSAVKHQTMKTLVDIKGGIDLFVQMWNPEKINTSNSNRIAFFTSAKVYISSVTMPTPNGTDYRVQKITPPTNAKYIRIGVIAGDTGIDNSISYKVEESYKATPWVAARMDIVSTSAAIQEESSARATAFEAIAESMQELSSNINTQNYLFRNNKEKDKWINLNGSDTELVVVNDVNYGNVIGIGNNVGNDNAWLAHEEMIEVLPQAVYKITYMVRQLSGSGTTYLGAVGCKKDGTLVNTVGANSNASQFYMYSGLTIPNPWSEYVGYIAANGVDLGELPNSKNLHKDATHFRALVIANYPSAPGNLRIASVRVEVVDGALAATVNQTSKTVAKIDGTVDASYSLNVTTVVGSKKIVGGMKLGANADQSYVAFDVGKFQILNSAGSGGTPFEVVGNDVFIKKLKANSVQITDLNPTLRDNINTSTGMGNGVNILKNAEFWIRNNSKADDATMTTWATRLGTGWKGSAANKVYAYRNQGSYGGGTNMPEGECILKLVRDNITDYAGTGWLGYIYQDVKVIAGQKYIYSIYGGTHRSLMNMTIQEIPSFGGVLTRTLATLRPTAYATQSGDTDNWTRHEVSFIGPASGTVRILTGMQGYLDSTVSNNAHTYIYRPMLEEAGPTQTMASSWSSGGTIIDSNSLYVDTAMISDATIGVAQIRDLKVNSAQVTDFSAASANIAKTEIGKATITTAQISGATINTAQIANATIGISQIRDLKVTMAQITNLKVGLADINTASITKLSSLASDLGAVTAGSINIGNKFIVNSAGDVTAKSGTFEGTVLANKISGTIDIDSMKRSAWMPSWDVYYNPNQIRKTPSGFDRGYSGSLPSRGSIDSYYAGDGSFEMSSVMFEVSVLCSRAVTVTQKVILCDDFAFIWVNGTQVRSFSNAQRLQNISYSLVGGSNLIQIILTNDYGGATGLVLAGDFIDNSIVKFK